MHEAAEYLMGHPIWTHHFASKDLSADMRKKVLEQCPDMPTELPGVTSDNYSERLVEIEASLGATVVIRKGDGSAAMHPFEGIPTNKPTLILHRS